jgi:hypothetical protein
MVADPPQALQPHEVRQRAVDGAGFGALARQLHGGGDQRVVDDDVRTHLDSNQLQMQSEV